VKAIAILTQFPRFVLKLVWKYYFLENQRNQHRTLPFADGILSRWERARLLGFGEGSSIFDSSIVIGAVSIGQNTWIGPFTLLDGSGSLEIGQNCSISAGVQIYTHDSVARDTSGHLEEVEKSPVKIGNSTYIGPNCVITRGITIGDRCIIGANSLVNIDVPSGSKAWGTPCRIQNND